MDNDREMIMDHFTSSTPMRSKLHLRFQLFILRFIETFATIVHQSHQVVLKAEKPKYDEFAQLIESVTKAITNRIFQGPFQILDKPAKKGIEKGIHIANNAYMRRKARKIVKGLSQRNIEANIDVLAAGRLIQAISILACDICYMYQQQILLIDGGTDCYYIAAFADDCVNRITGYLHARQGKYGSLSHFYDFWTKSSEARQEKQEKLHNCRSTNGAANDVKIPELVKFLIEGLWKDHGRSKSFRKWVTGSQIQINLDVIKKGKQVIQKLKVIFNNLIDRVHVKCGNKYYFPAMNCNPIIRFFSRFFFRIVNGPQDDITKRCGYRLQSLILKTDTTTKDWKEAKTMPIPRNSYCAENKMVLELDSYDKLTEFAQNLIDEYLEDPNSCNE